MIHDLVRVDQSNINDHALFQVLQSIITISNKGPNQYEINLYVLIWQIQRLPLLI